MRTAAVVVLAAVWALNLWLRFLPELPVRPDGGPLGTVYAGQAGVSTVFLAAAGFLLALPRRRPR